VQGIKEWLDGLGLGEYAPRFAENDIDFAILTDLTDQDLEKIELRAALSLAKLYQSNGRPADAHAVLAPALEGFSPTVEFSEIEEAQTLLAALAETEEVKNAKVSRC
jgi:predicted ATPase